MADAPDARARRAAGISLRTILVVLVGLPFLTSLLFSFLWARDRSAAADAARIRAEEVELIIDSAELRFSVDIDNLIGYDPVSDIDPRGETQSGDDRDELRDRQAFLGERLLARPDVLDRLGGANASEDLRVILADLDSLSLLADGDAKLDLQRNIGERLKVFDDAVNAGASASLAEVAYTLRDFGRLQGLMEEEASYIIKALTPEGRTQANAARIEFLQAEQAESIESLSTVLDPVSMRSLRAEADQPSIQLVRDAIATESGLDDRGVTLASLDLLAMVDDANQWFYSVPRAREIYAAEAVVEAEAEVQASTNGRRVAAGVATALIVAVLLVTPLVIRSVTAPLKSLARRASVAAAGNPPEPATDRSITRELRAVNASFEQLTDFLGTVESQLGALGYGHTDDSVLSKELPGAIGADIRRSVDRMTTANDQLRASEAMSNAILDAAVDGIWTLNEDLVVLSVNSAAEAMSGRTGKQLVGHDLATVHPELAGYLSSGIRRFSEQAFQLRNAHGDIVDTLVSGDDVLDADGTPVLTLYARDVSERKHYEDRLTHQAHHDHLTGLPNRLALVDEIDRALATMDAGTGVGLLFLDLDRFKLVNDALGHETGDQLLVSVGDRIHETLRDGDVVARLGGDEFVIVLRGLASEQEAEAAANRVRRILAQPIDIGGVDEMRLEASVGVAWVADAEIGSQELLHRADLAMYRAKQTGRARVEMYDSEMQAWATQRNRVEQGLRNALIAGDLDAHVQPIIDLHTGEVVGGELLARWFHEGEWIPPDVFIPLAEESALIGELGKWVLHRACEILAEWEERGWDLYLTVNISGLHVMTGDVDGDVLSALAAFPINPRRLKIEITESFLLGDPEMAIERLSLLRRMGISLLVDDFGTGYSSLTYLRQLPIDGIKLDRSFVNDATGPDADTSIVDLVSDLADSLGLTTVAEGIETDEQLATIRDAGYDLGQGWLWSKALPAPQFAEWVADGHTMTSSGT